MDLVTTIALLCFFSAVLGWQLQRYCTPAVAMAAPSLPYMRAIVPYQRGRRIVVIAWGRV